MVPFSLPSIGPTTTMECQGFEDFEEALKKGVYSSAIGWVIRQKEKLLKSSAKEFITTVKIELQGHFGMKVRSCISWAVCLFFINQVKFSVYINIVAMHGYYYYSCFVKWADQST